MLNRLGVDHGCQTDGQTDSQPLAIARSNIVVSVRVTVILMVYVMISFCRGIALFPVFYAFRICISHSTIRIIPKRRIQHSCVWRRLFVMSSLNVQLRVTKRQSLSWNKHKQIYKHTENSIGQGTGASTIFGKECTNCNFRRQQILTSTSLSGS